MKVLLLVVACASVILAYPSIDAAGTCKPDECLRPNCVCVSSISPLLVEDTPQLVTLTFDDSVTSAIYDSYYTKLLFNRKNADGSPIGATLYVSHQYSDYEKVNNLYNKGFEIGVNSISKGTADYFAKASTELLIDEFYGQRQILSKFANISIDDIKGVRTPHFQLAEDRTFEAYVKSGLEYDSSWTAHSDIPFFPYTLDYQSQQPCLIGQCPKESYPGFWIAPINNVVGQNGIQCNVLFACQINGTAEEIRDWLIVQYERSRNDEKAPLSFLVNSAFFQLVEDSFKGLELFLDYLATQEDTFVVSHSEVIRWSKTPVELSQYKPTIEERNRGCSARTCALKHEGYERYMRSCVPCPLEYPWVGNPEGNF